MPRFINVDMVFDRYKFRHDVESALDAMGASEWPIVEREKFLNEAIGKLVYDCIRYQDDYTPTVNTFLDVCNFLSLIPNHYFTFEDRAMKKDGTEWSQ